MAENPTSNGIPERLVEATVKLLAEKGPSAIKARAVAAETGLSTMVVYSHFGGIPELVNAVVDHGSRQLERAFSEARVTDDPVADVTFTVGLGDERERAPASHEAALGLYRENG